MSDSNKLCFGAGCCSSTAKACAKLQLSQAGQGGTGAEAQSLLATEKGCDEGAAAPSCTRH